MNSPNFDRIKIPSGLWEGIEQIGISAQELALQAKLPLTIRNAAVVTTDQYFSLWEAYSDLVGDTAKAIVQLATGFETNKYPPTVLVPYHARDYRDAINRMAQYKKLCPPESLNINENGDECTIELEWKKGEQAGPPLLVGITLAFILELGRRGTGQPLTAQLVEFTHDMGDLKYLEAFFGCKIRIGAACNRLTLKCEDLDIPFESYNNELLELLTPALNKSLNAQHNFSITETVKWIMKENLAGGQLDIQAVAKELNMSSRTLQRRLREANTSFKQLLTEVRHQQAMDYLVNPYLNMKEVAFLIGFEDQNSFYRAFRLWERDTPSNWRRNHLVTR